MKIKAIAISIGIFLGITLVACAATAIYFSTPTIISDWEKPGDISLTDVFPEGGEIGPGESKSINLVITSGATLDMYAFIRVVMPRFSSSGLYSLNVADGWSIEESGVKDGKFVTVYRYGDIVAPGEQTTPLATQITMKDIGEEEYAGLGDINVEVGGYACSTEDMDIDDVWGAIKEHYEL